MLEKGGFVELQMMCRNWSKEEDETILQLQKQWGNKWAAIAKVILLNCCDGQTLQNRTPNDVKSRYKSLSKQRMNG